MKYLSANREVYIKAAATCGNDEDAENYAIKFTGLLIALSSNYELLLIKSDETSAILFQLLLDSAAAKNLQISQISLNFWDEFKETITNFMTELP